jgi:predicted nucleotidyltransferase
MRLSETDIFIIKEAFNKIFQKGDIFLFGSRVDDNKKGGDIDLYICLDDKNELFEKKLKFLSFIKRKIGDRKIDIVFNKDKRRLIEREAIKNGIKL